ncbi:hypothetical protein GCM10027429_28800 [Marivirga atlantica]|uniref:Outer membrane beta-barrel protein n=1 Tax=Marivirga atlantica TaxID=1548457 RepID=A0A937DJZ2_9BACT|nr:outer membrane beta-barrel protein [Marivirga atlantica]MBL0766460.1 outer membrane beta-barrel protein [Marivirga atlantica]
MKKLFIIFLLIVVADQAFAQSFYNRRINRRWVASGGVGYARALGDLTNPGSYFDTKLNIEGGIHYRITDRLNLRTNLLLFQMSGDDGKIDQELNTRERGLSFVSNNIELSSTLSVSLFPMTSRFTQRKLINPYIFAGIGGLYFDPRATVPDSVVLPVDGRVAVPNAGQTVSLAKYDTERPNDYSRFAVVVPVGIGVRVKVTEFLDISAEISQRITFTDYLDDVSGPDYSDAELFDYANNDRELTAFALSNPNNADLDATRGNPDNDDFYMIVNLKADFYIQGDFFNRLFGIGGKKFNIKPKRGGGLFGRGSSFKRR